MSCTYILNVYVRNLTLYLINNTLFLQITTIQKFKLDTNISKYKYKILQLL